MEPESDKIKNRNQTITMSNQLVLVTGISGFVATHVALEFLKNGHRVRGTVRSQDKADLVKKTPVFEPYKEQLSFVVVEDLVTGDFAEAGKDTIDSLCHGPEADFFLRFGPTMRSQGCIHRGPHRIALPHVRIVLGKGL